MCAALLATACTSSGGTDTLSRPSARAEKVTAPPPDKGPLCDGDKDGSPGIGGIRILRGGTARLGGTAVAYTEARADGRSRTAVLAEGETPLDRHEGRHLTVAPRQEITVKGHSYTVRQICAYRVVLTPKNPADAAPSPSPTARETARGRDDRGWPDTVDGRWRLRWHVPHTQFGADGISVVVSDIQGRPDRADIAVASRRDGEDASYHDARVGDTLEIADRLWRVAAIGTGNMDAPEGSREFAAGYVDLRSME
ncbi:DUF6406 domain-containing protein [Streptomyces sp. I05A-00742]|uniref:DUF6406 domain-containing protein n=1 Tax=Streptomyces sp. I05A-00742 TaxID=2732853 RepID=UPI0014899E1B|nr:DUF6406 domain-containing protein [Streptomyces sp. I05A-00742]